MHMTDTLERTERTQRPYDNPIRGLVYCLLAYATIIGILFAGVGMFVAFT